MNAVRAGAVIAAACLLAASPVPGAPVTLDVQRHTLPNGLVVLTLEDHSAPLFTYHTWYRVGSRNERPGITGISHLLEHLMFDGAKKYGPKQFDRVLQQAGGVNNAFTAEDVTSYYQTVASGGLDLVLDLEADRMADLLLTPESVEAERQIVKEERRWSSEEDPFGLLYEELGSTAYQAHPYLWPVIGWESDLDAITRDDVRKHYETHYAPQNAVVILAGDFATADALRSIEKKLGRLPRRDPAPQVVTVEPPQRGERRVVVRKDVQLPLLMIGFHIPAARDSSLVPLEILELLLGRGESSRLHRRLVYEKALALWVQVEAERRADPSLFWIAAQVRQGIDPEAVEAEIAAELVRLAGEPPSDEEMSKARRQLESERIFSLEGVESRAYEIGRYEMLTGDWRNLLRDLERSSTVTAEEVRAAAASTFATNNRTVAVLVPSGEGEAR